MRPVVVWFATFAMSAGVATPVGAKSRFQPFEARNSIVEGTGGTRVTKNGIDYWTAGDPPRRYQILGIIVDKRSSGPLAGDAVGSKSVAKAAVKAGGDAVILLSQNTRMTGIFHSGQAQSYGGQAYGSGVSVPVGQEVAQLAVIKYLE